jgi:hypothetical protein
MDTLDVAVQAYSEGGLLAPENPNTDGSPRELWRTPSCSDGEGGIMEMRPGTAGKYKLRDHVHAKWATPSAFDWNQPETKEQWEKRAATQAEKGVNLHLPLKSQAIQVGNQWATPRAGKVTDEDQESWEKRNAKGDVATMPLTLQVKAWATPNAGDMKAGMSTGRRQKSLGQDVTNSLGKQKITHKLNPRFVETLMGLPVGWVMPSCAEPMTTGLTSSVPSGTESYPLNAPMLIEPSSVS